MEAVVALPQNHAKRLLEAGEVALGTTVSIARAPEVALVLKAAGFDFALLDMEHSCSDLETVAAIALLAREVGLTPIARVGWLQPSLLSRALDVGAQGVLVPHVETKQEMEAIVHATKYHPQGMRGLVSKGPHNRYAASDLALSLEQANRETLLAVMIESVRALENLEEILSVEGIDLAVAGYSDLSQDMGVPGQFSHPRVLEGIRDTIQACRRHGVAAAVPAGSAEAALQWVEEGANAIILPSDYGLILEYGKQLVEGVRRSLGSTAGRRPGGARVPGV